MKSQRCGAGRVVGAMAVVACVSVAACGGGGASGSDDDAETTEGPTTEAPATTTTTLDPEAQALADAEAAYLAYEQAYTEAAADPVNPQHPELQSLITGDLRIHSNSDLGGFLARGEALRPAQPSRFSSDVLSATPQSEVSVLLRVCQVDDRVVYSVATGDVVDDDVVTKTIDAVMVNEGGSWKVSYTTLVDDAEGVASCASG